MARTSKASEPLSGVLKSTVDFAREIAKRLKDPFLLVLWGVEVLLFAVLALMIASRGLSQDQDFILALVIVASIVGAFLVTVWRLLDVHREKGPKNGTTDIASPARSLLAEQARECLTLMLRIAEANGRNLTRARGGGAWARLSGDTYNHLCESCHQRRLGGVAPDAYIDTLCAEPDFMTVCDSKWSLGEALEVYRQRIAAVSPTPIDHDDLQRLVLRSIVQPDCSPQELDRALGPAIERARALATPARRR